MPLSHPPTSSWFVATALLSTITGVMVGIDRTLAQSPAISSQRSLSTPSSSNVLLAQIQDAKNQPSPGLKTMMNRQPIPGVVASNNPSPIQSSVPSLWWVSEQLAALDQFGSKLIQRWVAYPPQTGEAGQVDLLVNRQQWSLLDYFQRYEFVNKFSTIARSFGYNTRVYDNPDRIPVALYVCDFSPVTARILPSSKSYQATSAKVAAVPPDLANALTCNLSVTGSIVRPR